MKENIIIEYNGIIKPEDEIKKYTHFIREHPNTKELYESRALAYIINQEYEKALADFQKAYELDPKNTYYLFCRADCFAKLNQWDNAVKEYKKILEIDDKDADAYRGIAEIFDMQQKDKEAEDLYTKTLSIENNVENYFIRAYHYMKKGEYKKAHSDLENALKLDPNDESVLCLKNIAFKKMKTKK